VSRFDCWTARDIDGSLLLARILDDVEAFAPGKARLFHKHFSRLIHGSIERWSSYLTLEGQIPSSAPGWAETPQKPKRALSVEFSLPEDH
jgi:hypothetical protein